MCLITKNAPKRATKDIVCYKLMVKDEEGYNTVIRRKKCGDIFEAINISLESDMEKCTLKEEKEIFSRTMRCTITRLKGSQACFVEWGGKVSDEYEIIDSDCVNLGGGYIHTFQTLEDISGMTLWQHKELQDDIHIIKCVIPKGAIYYEGYGLSSRKDTTPKESRYMSYASNKIVFKEDVTEQYKDKISIVFHEDMSDEYKKVTCYDMY